MLAELQDVYINPNRNPTFYRTSKTLTIRSIKKSMDWPTLKLQDVDTIKTELKRVGIDTLDIALFTHKPFIGKSLLQRFINKFPNMSVTGPRRAARHSMSCKRAVAQDTLCLAREPRPPGKVGLLIWLSLVADRWVCLRPFTPSHMCKDGRRYVRSTGNFLCQVMRNLFLLEHEHAAISKS